MPVLSRFLGIVIIMWWEKNARHHKAHFHARYNEYRCVFSIPELEVLEGTLPNRILSYVKEWASQHISELEENWKLAMNNEPLKPIAPLV